MLGHPQTLAFVLLFRMLMYHLRARRREGVVSARRAGCALLQKGIAQEMMWARPVWGWALFKTGDRVRGLAEWRRGSPTRRPRTTCCCGRTTCRCSPTCASTGQPDQAELLLEPARDISRSTDQQMFAAEWHRLRGQLLLARSAGRTTRRRRTTTPSK